MPNWTAARVLTPNGARRGKNHDSVPLTGKQLKYATNELLKM